MEKLKKNKNKLLSIILILSFVMPLFIFENKVEASEEPVGVPWITVNDEENRAELFMAGVSNKSVMTIKEGIFAPFRSERGNLQGYYSFVDISLDSPGGSYNVNKSGESTDFDNIVAATKKRWKFSYDYGFYLSNEYSSSLYQYSDRWSVPDTPKNKLFGHDSWVYWLDPDGDRQAHIHTALYVPPSGFYMGTGYNMFHLGRTSSGFVYTYYDIIASYDGDDYVPIDSIYTDRDTLIYSNKNIRINGLVSRADSNKIYIDYRNRSTGARSLASINSDGTGYKDIGSAYGELIAAIPSKGYLISESTQGYPTIKSIIRSSTNGGMEVTLLEYPGYFFPLQITDNYIYYHNAEKTYRQHIEYPGVNELVFNFIPKQMYTPDDEVIFYRHSLYEYRNTIYKHSLNEPPILQVDKPLNSTSSNYYIKEEGDDVNNKIIVEGSVLDTNNDVVTVAATLGGATKSITISNTSVAKTFKLTFDLFADRINEGNHLLTVTATDKKGEKSPDITRNIIVKGRVRHNSYLLLDAPLNYSTVYQDVENDLPYAAKVKYIHNPNYFKNSMGTISDNNIWRNGFYDNLKLSGNYRVTIKARDNPKADINFDEFRMWSKESLSEINLYIHRKPIAIFKATANTAGTVTVTNFTDSYDPDHQGEANHGIIAREWRWRNVNSTTWTTGSNPPTSLPANQDYIIALRVRDKDGIDGVGVWGDWTEVNLSTGPLAPLNALFTLDPSIVSHSPSKTITTTNLSSGPITKYEWIIRKDGVQQGSIISTSIPTSEQLKAYGIGKFTLQLRVGDATRWSEPYTLPYEVINNPPIASFNSPDVVYRDTNIKPVNTTPADLDGDAITYQWKLKQPNGTEYNISTALNPTFKIQSFIAANNISPISSISRNWEITLVATDSKGAKSEYTKELEVINSVPIAKLNGSTSVKQYETHNYTSADTDADTGDNPLDIFRWKHTKPDGSYEAYTTKDITLTFNEHGSHTIEHYVIDQIGDKSNIASLNVDVEENEAPKMTITEPKGTKAQPTVSNSAPSLSWIYTDSENDPQEKFAFDFYYADDDVLITSISEDDSTGNIRAKIIRNIAFDRLRTIKTVGRTYSKNKWSELSNEVYFIISAAPTGGFSFNKPSYNANYVRGEDIILNGNVDDTDFAYGDELNCVYYIKKSTDSEWGLLREFNGITAKNYHNFTFTIEDLTVGQSKDIYEVKQVVTDKVGNTENRTNSFAINNRAPVVNIIGLSNTEDNPVILSGLTPTIKWEFTDPDGDKQVSYNIRIQKANTYSLVTQDSKVSEEEYWIVNKPLEEGIAYAVNVSAKESHGGSSSSTKYFQVRDEASLSNLRITGVYDISWMDLFQNKTTGIATNYIIPILPTQVNPLSRHPGNSSIPIKIGYKVDFEIDALGFSDVNDKVEATVTFLDTSGNNVSANVKYKNNNRNIVSIDSAYKNINATKVSTSGNNSTWRFSYFLPATTIVDGKNDLVIKTNIKATKSSNGYVYDYNNITGWNGRLFQYTLLKNALEDYYIRGGN